MDDQTKEPPIENDIKRISRVISALQSLAVAMEVSAKCEPVQSYYLDGYGEILSLLAEDLESAKLAIVWREK